MFASLREGGGPREWWKEPAVVKHTKMQGSALALPYLYRARPRAVGTPCARRKVRLRFRFAQGDTIGRYICLRVFGGSKPPPYEGVVGALPPKIRLGLCGFYTR